MGVLPWGRKVDGVGKGGTSRSRCFSASPVGAVGPRIPTGAALADSLTAEIATGLGTSMPKVLPSVDLETGMTTSAFGAPLCMTQCKAGIKGMGGYLGELKGSSKRFPFAFPRPAI